MASVTVEVYSEKAIVVRNTMEHHGAIMTELGGTFNEKLKGGRGWIFSKYKLNAVKSIVDKLNSGQYGNEYEQKTTAAVAAPASNPGEKAVETVSKAEYLSLLSRVERLEALVAQGRTASSSTYTPMSVSMSKPKPVAKEPSDDDIDEDEPEEPVERKRLVSLKK